MYYCCQYNWLYTARVPKRKPEERSGHTEMIQHRVTPAQKQLLQEAAEREDATLSAWLRHVGLQLARREAVLTSTSPLPISQKKLA